MNFKLGIGYCIMLLLFSCHPKKQEQDWTTIPFRPQPYEVPKPSQFVKMHIPEDNPCTKEGIALGRRLFYDPLLSKDQSISCASCHQQALSFTDGNARSEGIANRIGKRSVPSLINVGFYYTSLFWDGRVQSLEDQVLRSVEDSLELHNSWDLVENTLRKHPEYPRYFRQAFGINTKEEIDRHLVAKAIAQFERTLVSHNSKYDQVQRGEAEFTKKEKRGWSIFFDASAELPDSECGHCHIDPLFTDLDFSNNGLEEVQNLDDFQDKGRGAVSGRYYDNGKFRTPTLRNIELTAPYMHDGRFNSLEEVIDHYIKGGHYSENASPNVRELALEASHIDDLIAFLKTLTDPTVLQEEAFSDPS